MGHLSLQAHFILLFALGLYIRTQRREKSFAGAWTLLLIVAFYINFYLTAMAIAILVSCQIDLYRKTINFRDLLAIAVPLVAMGISIPLMLGLAFSEAARDTGFG